MSASARSWRRRRRDGLSAGEGRRHRSERAAPLEDIAISCARCFPRFQHPCFPRLKSRERFSMRAPAGRGRFSLPCPARADSRKRFTAAAAGRGARSPVLRRDAQTGSAGSAPCAHARHRISIKDSPSFRAASIAGRRGASLARSEALVVLPNRSQTTCNPGARRARTAKSASFDQRTAPVSRALISISSSRAAPRPRSSTWSDG